ncbi:hypothetical protein MLD52_11410 [Puniceicoccaceae bacterium K14]|nr:hypothetical protein [Puniceicoccaceae bacterium K14]
MLKLDETIVQEYFEYNGFLVKALRKACPQAKRSLADEGASLYVKNSNFVSGGRDPAFTIFSSELRYMDSAIICVRGWHEDKAALATMTDGAEVAKYVETKISKKISKWFPQDVLESIGIKEAPMKILVAPVFPMHEQYRREIERVLREHGIDAILSFKSLLVDLIEHVNTKEVYPKSESLQLIRMLKTFDLVKSSQMNFG